MFTKYENPTINGRMVRMVKSKGNRRISIIGAILNLRTIVKVVEQMTKGLKEVVE
jgi:hypothetical protein